MSITLEIAARLDAAMPDLVALSHRIHQNPEVGFQEYSAVGWITDHLDRLGMEVTTGLCGLPTAFVARRGPGPLTLAVCAEYDALPGIGHACGHNVIAAIAVGVAEALVPRVADLGISLAVIGTPAEETGGGKVELLKGGAFDGAHAAMMVHPAGRDCLQPRMQASAPLRAHFTGRAAHAAAWPERGINAADAITVAQVGIGLLRQHIVAGDRIHGFVSRGGLAANVVPDRTAFDITIRSDTMQGLSMLRPRVEHCLHAGALATGCSLTMEELSPTYADMVHDPAISAIFQHHAARLGHHDDPSADADRPAGSTDLGSVSQVIPAIHPLLKIDAHGATNHQPAFAEHTAGPSADDLIRTGSLCLAETIVAVAQSSEQRARLLGSRGVITTPPVSREPGQDPSIRVPGAGR